MLLVCRCWLLVFVFFFKQKTAYEMRISDWSSECALPISGRRDERPSDLRDRLLSPRHHSDRGRPVSRLESHEGNPPQYGRGALGQSARQKGACRDQLRIGDHPDITAGYGFFRSEEHTSELQSLMRISYAVFRLKKKK